ncbi:hemin uptake protein HemP [Luteibacter sp. PPL552]
MLVTTPARSEAHGRDKVVPLRPAATVAARRIQSQRLLDGSRELVIEHQGAEYHLRLTRNDKLILTK